MTGKPAARQTDRVKGGVIVTGSVTVLIGSQGGIACSVCPGGMAVGSPVNPQLGVNHSMQHALQHGLPQSALAMLGDQGQNTLQRLNSLREQLEKQEQAERTPITVRYYHCDHLGTPLALTDERNQIVWAARLDPWGNVEQEFNPESIDQPIRLPGQHHDKDTDLYYNRHRYYDPSIGSYINQDPIGLTGGMNQCIYPVNPALRVDPTGLQSKYVDGRLATADRAAGIPTSEPGTPIHGSWCGPKWTGGRREEYSTNRDKGDYYQNPSDPLDAACQIHDKRYEACRLATPCDNKAKERCMDAADHELRRAANDYASSLPWSEIGKAAKARAIGNAVGINPFPPLGKTPASCKK